MKYYLMNKDNKLLCFETVHSLGEIHVIETERISSKMPIGFTDIALWLENRNYAKHKDSLKGYLHEWGIDNTEGFIDATHCLGLNDTLWVKPIASNLHWDDVSLYQNDFSDVMEKTAFGNGQNGIEISTTDLTSPEFVSPGSFAKCWKREADGIYLYKTTGSLSQGLEPFSEYFASQIAEKISVPAVRYELTKLNGRLCTKCKMFTSEEIGLASFGAVFDISKRQYNISTIVESCERMGFGEQIRKMYLLDSLILNQDRHLGNLGFLFNNDTFEIVDFAPVFDFNLSMLCDAKPIDMIDHHTIDTYIDTYGIKHKTSDASFFSVAIDLGIDLPCDVDFYQHEKYKIDSGRFRSLYDYIQLNYSRIKHRNNNLHRIVAEKKVNSIVDCINNLKTSISTDEIIIEITKRDFLENEYFASYRALYGLADNEKIIIHINKNGDVNCIMDDGLAVSDIGKELIGDIDTLLNWAIRQF